MMNPVDIAGSLTNPQAVALEQWRNQREILSACPYDIQLQLMELGLIERSRPMLTQSTKLGRDVLATMKAAP